LADLYDAIKTAFDAATSLIAGASDIGPFDELHSGEVGSPSDVPVPYCTMVDPQESNEEGAFDRWVFVQESFNFEIVDATLELVRDHAELVNAVFDSFSLPLSAAGLRDVRLTKIGQGTEQAAEDRWACAIDYDVTYWRRRPA